MKILDRDALLARRRQWRDEWKRVVWTNGCFDLLHIGHLASLRAAKSLGDILVVGINSDRSVQANKGPSRPILNEYERAELMAALECVDAVYVFDELTPVKILSELQPEIHCKGAEYKPGRGRLVPEASVVESYGGRIEYLPLVRGVSTSDIIARIQHSHARAA